MSSGLVGALKQAFRKSFHEVQGSYILVTGELDEGSRIVVCATDGYAKVVLYEDVLSLDCREIEYEPHGLYAFSEDPEELVKKVVLKAVSLSLRKRAGSL